MSGFRPPGTGSEVSSGSGRKAEIQLSHWPSERWGAWRDLLGPPAEVVERGRRSVLAGVGVVGDCVDGPVSGPRVAASAGPVEAVAVASGPPAVAAGAMSGAAVLDVVASKGTSGVVSSPRRPGVLA
ncbi:hypothetical protein, partial [Saccharothrix longispora]|uniref:hypothetical protein n=1 Tax=Saccharothrix longispora TaxID=33920 RepID=UPI0028FD4A27